MYHSLDRTFIKTSKTTRKASFKDEVLSKKHIAGGFKDEVTSTMVINQCDVSSGARARVHKQEMQHKLQLNLIEIRVRATRLEAEHAALRATLD